MRKLFFFRSSSSSGNSNSIPPSSTHEKVYWDASNQLNDKVENNSHNPKDKLLKSRKQFPEIQASGTGSVLRRSLSFSSASVHSCGLGERNLNCLNDQSCSPSSGNCVPPQESDYPACCRTLTPEKCSKLSRVGPATNQKGHRREKKTSSASSSRGYPNSSGDSSYSSPPMPLQCRSAQTHPNETLDLYIDGEQQQERNLRPKNKLSQRIPSSWRPPRVQSTAPPSPTGNSKERPISHSFREMRGAHLCPSSSDITRNEFWHESPRELAKNVVERLSQLMPKTKSQDFDPDTPTTVEDIFEDYLDPQPNSKTDAVTQKGCLSDGPLYRSINDEISGFEKQIEFPGDGLDVLHPVQTEDYIDAELRRRAKEAEERVMFLSDELEQETFIPDSRFTVPALLLTIRNLTEERRSLAFEISSQLQCRINERATAKEALRLAKVELDSRTRRLEKEKNELQSGLEKELDRRSSDWSFKLEKYQSEEQRLRERVRELAEHNVSLQREVSSLIGRDTESRSRITHSEIQLKDLTIRAEEAREENLDLRRTLSELQEHYKVAEADCDCIRRNYREKEKENKDFQKIITRLQRTCSEQEKTINGLQQGLGEEIDKKQSLEKFDNHVCKLQMEQVRLTSVEQVLRKEVESYRLDVESLRHENINLLNRLKGSGKDGGSLCFKLDQELCSRVDCLRNQGLSLLKESTQLCSRLLEFVKGKTAQQLDFEPGTEHLTDINQNGLDGYFLVESDMKVDSFRRGIENLTRSLQAITSVLHEKSNPVALEPQSPCTEGGEARKSSDKGLEDDIIFKLKAETMLTSILREKLCSKELEVEQLQAEVATAIRGHDILRCKIQSTVDSLSCTTHKMRDLELQVLKKDDTINRLRSELQDYMKELTVTRGILQKVSEERDLMWDEVKQYSEKNMLLNSEVNSLKKKIETLDEDILLKEGQITILKDSLGNKPFDILSSPKSIQEFMLE